MSTAERLRAEPQLDIERPSIEQQFRAIETIPSELTPKYLEAKFVFDEFLPTINEQTVEDHLAKTAEHGVIPFSTLELVFGRESQTYGVAPFSIKTHIPEYRGSVYDRKPNDRLSPEERKKIGQTVTQGILGGLRFNEIDFKGEEGSFEEFRANFLPYLKQNGYEIKQFEIWLSQFRSGSHYTEGISPGAIIEIDKHRIRLGGLNLDQYRGLPDEHKQLATNWFERLQSARIPRSKLISI